MNQLTNLVGILVIASIIGCSDGKTKKDRIKENVIQNNAIGLSSKEKDSIDSFFQRARQAAQSNDENKLKEIIEFPLLGLTEYGDSLVFETFEDLKSNGGVIHLLLKS